MKNNKSKFILFFSVAFVFIALAFVASVRILKTSSIVDNKKTESEVQLSFYIPDVLIKHFEFKETTVKPGDKVPYEIQTEYYQDHECTIPDENFVDKNYRITLKNINNGSVVVAEDTVASGNQAFHFNSNQLLSGTYKISKLEITARHKDNLVGDKPLVIFADNCHTELECKNMVQLQQTLTFEEVPVEETIPVYEYTVGLSKSDPEVVIGDKISLNIKRLDRYEEVNLNRKDLKTLLLSYTNEQDGNVINVFVKSINSNPYIIVPSSATVGKYNLDYGYLSFVDDTYAKYQNTDTKTFSYNTSFIVKEPKKDTSKYYYSNDTYNENVASDLGQLDDDAIITVDASKAPLIKEDVFNAIKGKKQTLIIEYETSQWVFSGKDIVNAKDIDVSVLFSKLTKDGTYYDEFLRDNVSGPSALLQFSDNGDLPGKVLIKIDKESVDAYLNDPKKVFVYFYKEDSDKLLKVAMEIQSNNGFYEFYINHNSKYILTSEEIVTNVVSDDVDMLALNHQITVNQQSSILVYILGAVCGLLVIGLVVALLSKKKKQVQAQ